MGSLNIGGAEKSLVSMLNLLPDDKYEIDLLLLRDEGSFRNSVPEHVNVLSVDFPYECLVVSPKNIKYYLNKGIRYFIKKLYSLVKLKTRRYLSMDQVLWEIWRDEIPVHDKQYDAAISYIEGIPNYYVLEKIKAARKIIWVHNEYSKLGYNADYDLTYFQNADAIVTISELCRSCLINTFPSIASKFHVLENLTDPSLIKKMAEQEIDDPQFTIQYDGLKILSIGRLHPQKQFDLAIKAARIIKDSGIRFKWYIIGEGSLRHELEQQIRESLLTEDVLLLGVRKNPYSYMKLCDIVVQSSLYEGKSIVVDEAKILNKPIVATRYETVYDVIADYKTGVISDMTPKSLAASILEVYSNISLRELLINNLSKERNDNVKDIQKYIKVIDGD